MFSVALLFSLNYILSKVGMREFSPLTFAWLRVAGSAVILAAIVRSEGREAPEAGDRKSIWGLAVLGVVLNQTLFLSGLAFTTVAVAAVLITTIPVFALGAAILTGRERPTLTRTGGIALAGAGALLVVGGEGFSGEWRSLAGAVMIVLNCLSYALYLVRSKPIIERLGARRVVARMFAAGALLLLPVAAVPLWRESWRDVPPAGWTALALVIAGPTVAAYLLNAWTLRYADSSLVAAYTYVQPVLASLLGAVFLSEPVRPTVVAAAVLIFAGVALAGRASGPVPE